MGTVAANEPVDGVAARGHKGFAIAGIAVLALVAAVEIRQGGPLVVASGWPPPSADDLNRTKHLFPLEWWLVCAMLLVGGLLKLMIAVVVWLRRPSPPLWTIAATLIWGAWAWFASRWPLVQATAKVRTEVDLELVSLNYWYMQHGIGDLFLPLCAALLAAARWLHPAQVRD